MLSMFYRTSFVGTPFESLRFIRNKLVILDINLIKTLINVLN